MKVLWAHYLNIAPAEYNPVSEKFLPLRFPGHSRRISHFTGQANQVTCAINRPKNLTTNMKSQRWLLGTLAFLKSLTKDLTRTNFSSFICHSLLSASSSEARSLCTSLYNWLVSRCISSCASRTSWKNKTEADPMYVHRQSVARTKLLYNHLTHLSCELSGKEWNKIFSVKPCKAFECFSATYSPLVIC